MFGIRFMKASPTTYVMLLKNGQVVREGAGISFWYYAPTSTLVSVPLSSSDLPFVFSGVTADFQAITVQGQLTHRVADPKKLAALLDMSVDPAGRNLSADPEMLPERLCQIAQILTRAATERLPLREVLAAADSISASVLAGLREAQVVKMHGVEVLDFSIQSIKPTPEMARAFEAAAREALQRDADEAIYARRNAAVEQERTIKESELNTQIAIEEKQRQIREAKMNADIVIEEQRGGLIDRRVANDGKDAESRARSLDMLLEPVRGVDWRTLVALGAGGNDPRLMFAVAFRELAENAQKIGSLNLTPDLLGMLLEQQPDKEKNGTGRRGGS